MSFLILVVFILSSGFHLAGTYEGQKEMIDKIKIKCKTKERVSNCLNRLVK